MDIEQQSIEDIWNNLYVNDTIDLILHSDSLPGFIKQLAQEKYRQLKGTGDKSRIKMTSTAKIGEEGWLDVHIQLIGRQTVKVGKQS